MNRGEGRGDYRNGNSNGVGGGGGGSSRYRPYESQLLNELHDIMPEGLYDSDMFNSPLLRFFQQRVGHMFPAYHRERGIYLRDQAESRRHAFRSTRLSRMPNPVMTSTPPTQPTVTQTLDSSTFPDTFLRTLLLSIVAENAARPESVSPPSGPAVASADTAETAEEEEEEAPPPLPRTHRNVHRLVRTERSGITVTIPGGTTTWWDPVSIRPSIGVYNRNTVLVDASGVPAGTVCTICQSSPGDDLSGATILDTVWRKLRGCQHSFHKRCADRWFENHIQCPNCRADIRIGTQPTAPAGPAAEPGDGPMLDM